MDKNGISRLKLYRKCHVVCLFIFVIIGIMIGNNDNVTKVRFAKMFIVWNIHADIPLILVIHCILECRFCLYSPTILIAISRWNTLYLFYKWTPWYKHYKGGMIIQDHHITNDGQWLFDRQSKGIHKSMSYPIKIGKTDGRNKPYISVLSVSVIIELEFILRYMPL